MDKDDFIKYYIDKGWSAEDALGEWRLHVIEEEMGEIAKKKSMILVFLKRKLKRKILK